jgi:hypothetical protein
MPDFYTDNQNRKYPFHDSATLMDDSGQVLPDGLLVDLSLTMDSTLGNLAYVSAITKKNGSITVILSAAATGLPIAISKVDVSNQSLLVRHRRTSQMQLEPLSGLVAGTIILGENFTIIPDASYSFSTPAQSMLTPRTVFSMAIPGNQRIGVYSSGINLAGAVAVGNEGDIELVFEPRVLGGRTVNAAVFRLKGSSQVLATYSASLPRPESRTCGNPQPIESINNVRPDCCGRIFIEFRGCAAPTPILNHCGVVLECALTLDDICPPKTSYADKPQTDLCAVETGSNQINQSEQQPDAPV